MVSSEQRVVVTGASGFFGRHLVPFLDARGYKVVAASRQEMRFPNAVRAVKIDDIADVDWAGVVDGAAAVVHLAGLAHATSFIPESDYRRINVLGTKHIAHAARRVGAKIVLMSSVAAQSGPSSKKILEESDAPIPTNAYGRSKLAAEEEVKSVGRNHVIFRPSLTYGLDVMGNMGRLVKLAISALPPPLGALTNLRSILAVENMCEAVAFALEKDRALGETFLLADREPISVADMVRCLRRGAGYAVGAIPVPPNVLAYVLRRAGRYDLWDKLASDLMVSVEKLDNFGFQWTVGTADALKAFGKSYAARRQRR
jgi:nucleoside-diphosphate-sugar epimerase